MVFDESVLMGFRVNSAKKPGPPSVSEVGQLRAQAAVLELAESREVSSTGCNQPDGGSVASQLVERPG